MRSWAKDAPSRRSEHHPNGMKSTLIITGSWVASESIKQPAAVMSWNPARRGRLLFHPIGAMPP
jgi:hypothetical protein